MRIGVLVSGRGSNLGALMQAVAEPDFPAEIALVVSNRADAGGLKIAAAAGIETAVLPGREHADRRSHEAAIHAALRAANVDLVCLAGYMRILTPFFVEKWQGRMINVHPSLLPLFPGLETHRRAIEAGMRLHGCTVHFVTAVMDEGPIIAQAAVPVIDGDDAERLAARVLKAEHRTYPLALRLVASGKVRMEGSRAIFDSGLKAEDGGMLVSPEPGRDSHGDLESLARLTP